MAAVPGVIGGKLAGVIRTTRNIEPQEGFHLTLNCVRQSTTGKGKNRSTTETVEWQDQRVMEREMLEHDLSTSAVPVLFKIPYDARPSSETPGGSRIIWRLEVKARTPGIDYSAAFDVPVFKTADTRPDFELDESLVADYTARSDPDLDLRSAGVRKTLGEAGRTRYVFPMARHPGISAGVTAILAVLIGVLAILIHLGAPLLFPIVISLFGLLMLCVALDMWSYRSVIEVSTHSVTVRGGWFGIGPTRELTTGDVHEIRVTRGDQTGKTVFHNIVLTGRDGKKITVGKHLPNKQLAEAVVRDINRSMEA